ncbi:MAG: DUF4399 domain-containing protein [Gemmatimonadetes bacterium]|nr:DUF4399 domain-containing protein [Gemmatimonadota bacterium]
MTSPSIRSIALAGLLALGAPVAVLIAQNAPTPAPAVTPAALAPEIFFRAPANGATVGPTFPVVFGLRNYGVAPAGVRMSNTGHFHVLIDTEVPAAGVVIPGDSLHRHFGAGQIETTLTLSPGTHTLRLVLGDADHKVIGPALVSAPIRVTVRPR